MNGGPKWRQISKTWQKFVFKCVLSDTEIKFFRLWAISTILLPARGTLLSGAFSGANVMINFNHK